MNSRTVLSARATGASPVEDCSVGLEESYGQRDAAAATPALLVGSIKFSGVTAGSKIKLTAKGTLEGLGSAKATISAELYDFVLSQVRASKLLITLEHSQTRVTNIRFENI